MLSFHDVIVDKSQRNAFCLTLLPGAVAEIEKVLIGKKLFDCCFNNSNLKKGAIFYQFKNISSASFTYMNHVLEDLLVEEYLNKLAHEYDSLPTVVAAIFYLDLRDLLNIAISKLSYDERIRVTLAKLLICHTNLWLLDMEKIKLSSGNLDIFRYLISSKASSGGIILITGLQKIEKFETLVL